MFVFLEIELESCNLVNTFRHEFRADEYKAQFFGPDWPNFCILREKFDKIIKKQSFLEQNLLI